jgi:hypothetical protein
VARINDDDTEITQVCQCCEAMEDLECFTYFSVTLKLRVSSLIQLELVNVMQLGIWGDEQHGYRVDDSELYHHWFQVHSILFLKRAQQFMSECFLCVCLCLQCQGIEP